MSGHWIYINSPAYRRFIEASKHNKWLLVGATLALGGLGAAAASMTMGLTNPNMAEEGGQRKDEELAKLPLHSQVVARNNREQIRAMLLDVTGGSDADRYRDLLNGKIHKTTHGTSMPDPEPPK